VPLVMGPTDAVMARKPSSLNPPPADRTCIKKRAGGEFPAARVSDIIRYCGGIPAHGQQRMMPIWTKIFSNECGPPYSRESIWCLNAIFETIQK
jgi:hypothetical protein